MNKSLQGRVREVMHNNYTLYYFVYMYTQICDENALIWGFPMGWAFIFDYFSPSASEG
jgi:hypothetical protein